MEAGRPEGARTLEQFIAQSPGSELAPRHASSSAEAQAKAGRQPRGAGAVPGSRPHVAYPRAGSAGALPDRRAGAQAGPPADAEAAWTTLRRDFPQNALAGRPGSRRPSSMQQRKQWEPALQVAQSVADQRGDERSDALLVVGQSALQLRKNPEAAQAYHAVVVEAPPASKRYFEGLAGLAASLEAGDRQGRRPSAPIARSSTAARIRSWYAGPRAASPRSTRPAAARGSARPVPSPSPRHPRSHEGGPDDAERRALLAVTVAALLAAPPERSRLVRWSSRRRRSRSRSPRSPIGLERPRLDPPPPPPVAAPALELGRAPRRASSPPSPSPSRRRRIPAGSPARSSPSGGRRRWRSAGSPGCSRATTGRRARHSRRASPSTRAAPRRRRRTSGSVSSRCSRRPRPRPRPALEPSAHYRTALPLAPPPPLNMHAELGLGLLSAPAWRCR